jgi:hypothetical protein
LKPLWEGVYFLKRHFKYHKKDKSHLYIAAYKKKVNTLKKYSKLFSAVLNWGRGVQLFGSKYLTFMTVFNRRAETNTATKKYLGVMGLRTYGFRLYKKGAGTNFLYRKKKKKKRFLFKNARRQGFN